MEKRENETLTVRDIKQILNISINAAYNLIHSIQKFQEQLWNFL